MTSATSLAAAYEAKVTDLRALQTTVRKTLKTLMWTLLVVPPVFLLAIVILLPMPEADDDLAALILGNVLVLPLGIAAAIVWQARAEKRALGRGLRSGLLRPIREGQF